MRNVLVPGLAALVIAPCLLALPPAALLAQPSPTAPKPAVPKAPVVTVQEAKPEASGPETVQIKREAIKLASPKDYHVGLSLEPVESLALAAPMDGVVAGTPITPGQKVESQVEVIRLDKTELELQLERAKAELRAAQIEARRAKAKGDADAAELAEAHLQAAEATAKLAQYRFDRISVRAPFPATVFRVHVVPGEVVQAGQPLADLGDVRKLKVEIPIDRKDAEPGKPVEIKIEDQVVQAKIRDVVPLAERFEPLRSLAPSVTSAVVVIENERGTFSAGQTVYAPLIPRHPVTEVVTSALGNTGDGGRKVQVVRDDTIRDVPVVVLGQVGPDRMFVSGPFSERDEIVTSTSKELADGTRLRLMTETAASPAAPGRPAASGAGPTTGRPNF